MNNENELPTESFDFLADFPYRPVDLGRGSLEQPAHLFLGQGPTALEVVVARSQGKPGSAHLRDVWRRRQQGRGIPLMLAVLCGERAAVCGPSGEDPPVYPNVELSVAERICATALRRPNQHAALRFLYGVLRHIESELPGRKSGWVLR